MSWVRFRCDIDCDAKRKPPPQLRHMSPRLTAQLSGMLAADACINEDLYRVMADHLATDGYLAAGYNQVSIDDCWANMSRSADGVMIPDPSRFPSGLKALGDYMHARGVRFGIYSGEFG